MPIDSYYAPPEFSASPEKIEVNKAALKLAADGTPNPRSKQTPHYYEDDNASLKKLGLVDMQLVDENSPASKASGKLGSQHQCGGRLH